MSNCFLAHYLAEGRNAYQAILFDVDGTIASGALPLPHSAELLQQLKTDGMPFFLLTNDSCSAPAVKAARLSSIGIPVAPENIVSCAHTLQFFLKENNLLQRHFFVCGSLGTPSYADLAQIDWTDSPCEINDCNAIIFGEGEYEWKQPLEAVFNFLIAHPETPVIVPNPDSYWPLATGHGELGVGAGGHARFILQLLSEKGIRVSPFYLGKPYSTIYRHSAAILAKMLGHAPDMSRIAMIGDSLASDIRGGNSVGMHTVLVLSGITSASQLNGISPEITPKAVFDSL